MIGSAWYGATAAVRVPWLLRGGALARLLAEPDAAASIAPAAYDDARFATRIALHALAWLSRVPGDRWRNTCLFRAAAECWVLRQHGFLATLRIGVAHGDRDVVAHAWVECDGVVCLTAADTDAGYVRLATPT